MGIGFWILLMIIFTYLSMNCFLSIPLTQFEYDENLKYFESKNDYHKYITTYAFLFVFYTLLAIGLSDYISYYFANAHYFL